MLGQTLRRFSKAPWKPALTATQMLPDGILNKHYKKLSGDTKESLKMQAK